MWSVKCPGYDAGEAFEMCISRVNNSALQDSLSAIQPNIETAVADYAVKAEEGEIHLVPRIKMIGNVDGQEIIKIYKNGMVRTSAPGRVIYDHIKLLPDGDRCPFCDHRNVSTLDHFLPKSDYPIFAVAPINLIGLCADCNKIKSDIAPRLANDTMLHPYFDEVNNRQWLFARVVETKPAAVKFQVEYVDEWDDVLNDRVAHQFKLLRLGYLYSSQAAREIIDIRHNLQRIFDSGKASAVRDDLEYAWDSRQKNRINSWQTATYQALAKSKWFCEGGFAEA